MPGMPVPSSPQPSLIANCVVGSPASAGIVQRWGQDLAFALERNVQSVAAFEIPAAIASGSMRVAYNRTPGVNAIRIDLTSNVGSALGANYTMGVSVSSGAIAVIGDGYLTGTFGIDAGNPQLRMVPIVTGYFNVTGITPGTTVELIFTWANVASSTGPAYLSVREVALADTNPVSDSSTGATGEMGIDPSWASAGNVIINGSATTKNGLIRVVAQLDRARKDCRRHIQFATPEDNTTAWPVVSAASAAIPFGVNNTDFVIRVRARLLYTGTSNSYKPLIRYKCSGANTGNVSFVVTPVGGAPTTTTIAIPNSAAWATVNTGTVPLPVTGTGQLVDIQYQADTTAGTMYLGLLALTENES